MIVSTITVVATPKSKEQILETFLSVKGPSIGEAGCLGSRLYQEIPDEYLITYEELWQSEETLDNHIRSNRYRAVLAAMDLSSKPPQVMFRKISKMWDMGLIQSVLHDKER